VPSRAATGVCVPRITRIGGHTRKSLPGSSASRAWWRWARRPRPMGRAQQRRNAKATVGRPTRNCCSVRHSTASAAPMPSISQASRPGHDGGAGSGAFRSDLSHRLCGGSGWMGVLLAASRVGGGVTRTRTDEHGRIPKRGQPAVRDCPCLSVWLLYTLTASGKGYSDARGLSSFDLRGAESYNAAPMGRQRAGPAGIRGTQGEPDASAARLAALLAARGCCEGLRRRAEEGGRDGLQGRGVRGTPRPEARRGRQDRPRPRDGMRLRPHGLPRQRQCEPSCGRREGAGDRLRRDGGLD